MVGETHRVLYFVLASRISALCFYSSVRFYLELGCILSLEKMTSFSQSEKGIKLASVRAAVSPSLNQVSLLTRAPSVSWTKARALKAAALVEPSCDSLVFSKHFPSHQSISTCPDFLRQSSPHPSSSSPVSHHPC